MATTQATTTVTAYVAVSDTDGLAWGYGATEDAALEDAREWLSEGEQGRADADDRLTRAMADLALYPVSADLIERVDGGEVDWDRLTSSRYIAVRASDVDACRALDWARIEVLPMIEKSSNDLLTAWAGSDNLAVYDTRDELLYSAAGLREYATPIQRDTAIRYIVELRDDGAPSAWMRLCVPLVPRCVDDDSQYLDLLTSQPEALEAALEADDAVLSYDRIAS